MLDEAGLHMTGGGSGPFYGVRPTSNGLALRFLLGVMNFKLFGPMIRAQSTDLRGGYIKFSKQYIQSAATDHQIDRLVDDLYGLTADEIALVEGA